MQSHSHHYYGRPSSAARIDAAGQILRSLEQEERQQRQRSHGDHYDDAAEGVVRDAPLQDRQRRSFRDASLDSDNNAWIVNGFATATTCDQNTEDDPYVNDCFGNTNDNGNSNDNYDHSRNNNSLAKMDSLALYPEDDPTATCDMDDSLVVEHMLPDHAGRKRRRRRCLCISSIILMAGVVALTAALAAQMSGGNSSDHNVPSGRGDMGSSSSLSDNVFALDDLPDLYYILEPKVANASALLDRTTAEGKAFHSVVQQEKAITYNDTAAESAKGLDLIQRYALLTMYFGNEGDSWNNKDGWTEEGDVCTEWHGITCGVSAVTEINLSGNNLQGSISPDFCLLSFLEIISLSDNVQVEIPPCAAQLPFLREVYLNSNGFQGQLPKTFHDSSSLTHLDLSDNGFTASIRELFPANNAGTSFGNLRELILNNNDLSGDIPESSLRRLRNLERLELVGNPKLTGSLNEICKGMLMFAKVDCDVVTCRCCSEGPSCPSL